MRNKSELARDNRAPNQSANALKHGLTSTKTYVLQNESPDAWAEHLADCVLTFRPKTRYEHGIMEEIAFAKWRLMRIAGIETALIDIEMDEQAEELADKYEYLDECVRKAHAFKSIVDNSKSAAFVRRYETSLQRAIDRLILSLSTLRETVPSEPEAAQNSEKTEISKQAPPRSRVIFLTGDSPRRNIISIHRRLLASRDRSKPAS